MTKVYLAFTDCSNAIKTLQHRGIWTPSVLVSYLKLKAWKRVMGECNFRDWILDSGAFSAYNTSTKIDIEKFIADCQELFADPVPPSGIFALDVIGDWKASARNCEEMWKAGIEAIPCFHANEPWSALESMSRDYPRIALGGVALKSPRTKTKWAEQCFARCWPKRIHGFGLVSRHAMMALPFESVDSSSWHKGPNAWGRWTMFRRTKNDGKVTCRDPNVTLEVEYIHYRELENMAKARWRQQLQGLM